MRKLAVIVAGGIGQRMGTPLPKQFLQLEGKPLLWYTIDAFERAFEDIQLVLVLPSEHSDKGASIKGMLKRPNNLTIVVGGANRFESVKNGLAFAEDESIIFIHDGVRCLVSPSLIRRCYEEAIQFGSAIPVIPISDSVRIFKNGKLVAFSRDLIKMVQTPQTFLGGTIKRAYYDSKQSVYTDDASLAEVQGCALHFVDGEDTNIKVTTPKDLVFARSLISGDR